MSPKRVFASLLPTLLLLAPPAVGHHSSAPFDSETRITLRGTVARYDWQNPHVYLDVDARDSRGQTGTWEIELYNPGMMRRYGWSPDTLTTGDPVSVVAYGPRDPKRLIGLGLSVLRSDGSRLEAPDFFADLVEDTPATLVPAEGLAGRWLNPWDPALADQFGRDTKLVLTAKGRAALDSYDDSENPGRHCMLETAPYIMVYPIVTTIEIGEAEVIIRSDGYVERRVRLDIDSHDGALSSLQGHSIGRWDGDALVVDTVAFADHRGGNGTGIPSGLAKHLVERFELTPDRTHLSYTFRVEDPEYLGETVSATIELSHRPDLPAVPFVPCDLESARRYLDD